MYVIGSEYWGEKPNLLWILFVGQFSFADTNNGFFFHYLVEGFQVAAGWDGLMKKFVKLTLEFEFAILFKTYYYGRHDVRMKGW